MEFFLHLGVLVDKDNPEITAPTLLREQSTLLIELGLSNCWLQHGLRVCVFKR
jgi:hypothetical protein